MNGTIINIQHYAVHDGPGIRTLVFFKGCPLRCPWCCNPESQSPKPQLRYIAYRCKLCLHCMDFCTHSAITYSNGVLRHPFDLCTECEDRICIDKCCYDALSLTGRVISSEELVEIVSKDIPFYKNSGGGVTFSGGEPLAQPEFLAEVLGKCREAGIHSAVETCGFAASASLQAIIPLTDLFLFDLKILDPDRHLQLLGQPLHPVLHNLEMLASSGAKVIIRFPLVPGMTGDQENLEAIAALMKEHGLKEIHLEPYHSLGMDKYAEHGMPLGLEGMPMPESREVDAVRAFFTSSGLDCHPVW